VTPSSWAVLVSAGGVRRALHKKSIGDRPDWLQELWRRPAANRDGAPYGEQPDVR
jgi:hypothetical protein